MSYVLEVNPRSDSGKRASRLLRKTKSQIPGVVYGANKEPQLLSVSEALLNKAFKSDQFLGHLIEISLEGKSEKVLVKDIQRHAYLPKVLSIDFQRVVSSRKIKVRVPIRIVGDENCKDLKLGAVLSVTTDFALVSCLPKNLPECLEVDISELKVGSSLYLSDMALPNGVEIFNLLHNNNDSYNHCVLRLIKARKSTEAPSSSENSEQAPEKDSE